MKRSRIGSVLAVALVGLGCYSTGEGPDPVANALYFPVGLAVSPGGNALYVANSDFDLQYNGGTVEVYDLRRIRDEILRPLWADPADPDPCATAGLPPNANPLLQPGRCGPLQLNAPPDRARHPEPIVRATARIGAFATDVLYACRPGADPAQGGTDCQRGTADPRGARIFVPVRGDPSITFFDVDDDRPGGSQSFRLECGQAANEGRCADSYRAGVDPNENSRGLTLPSEPQGIAISDRGDAIVVTHQSVGAPFLSLITGRDSNGSTVLDAKPRLEFLLGGIPAPAIGIAPLPIPLAVSLLGLAATNYQPGFAVTYRGAAQVDVVRFYDDSFAAPKRPFLLRTGAFGLSATPLGIDARDVVFDNSPRSARTVCENRCLGSELDRCLAECAAIGEPGARTQCEETCRTRRLVDCATGCAGIPLGTFISNRSPVVTVPFAALLIGETRMANPTSSSESIFTYDSVPLAQGPSRAIVGRVHDLRDPPGEFRTRIFVVCFDARVIYVYDPVERRVEREIRTGRGPHALVMDPVEPIAYVGHFTDSYIGVIDLDQDHSQTFGSIVATIGVLSPPRGSR